MAGYPPPFTGSAGSPFGVDPRQQRRILKDHARLQKASFRAQRDLYRQQARALRRGSVLGPVLVVAIGVILLLVRTGRIPVLTFANWYGRWWPALFVAAGAVMLLEWAFDQRSSVVDAPYVRRGIGGGVVSLLILLALTGIVLSDVRDGRDMLVRNFNLNPDNFQQFLGEKHELEQQVDEPFAPGTTLSIDNPHGDVTVVGKSADNNIHIVVNKDVYSLSNADADSKAQQLSPRLVLASGTLSVTVPAMEGATADLNITVPDFGQVTVNANHGDVRVSMLHAPVSVTANRGDVTLSSIVGAVTAHINNNESSFSAHDIQGDLTLKGRADDLNLSNVRGQVALDGDFYGDTHMERLDGPISFQTSRTSFKVARLAGAIDISSDSNMTGDQLVGPTVLRTRSRNVSFERVTGDLDVSNSNGTVDVTSAFPLGNITIGSSNGAINLTVPEHAGFVVAAETKGGEIESNVGLTSATTGDRASLHGSVGDGSSRITLNTSQADISVHRGVVAPPAPPEPPPPTPARGARIHSTSFLR